MDTIIKIDKTKDGIIFDNQPVKVTRMGDITEIMYQKSKPMGMPFKKLDNEQYMMYDTGEVLQFDHIENRSEDKNGLGATFKKIRNYINNNFSGLDNEIHMIVTYAENMTNPKQLMQDFEVFWKRFKRKYGKQCEYMVIAEPQERGAWHLHILVKLPRKQYIDNNKELEPLWGHGFTKIKSLDNVDNIGAYLSAYLGDIELTNESDAVGETVKVKQVEGTSKKFIKGGRLHLYPPKFNIFRCSRGIKPPTSEIMKYENAKKIVGAGTPNYSSTITISDDNDIMLNKIVYEQYNKKRMNCKSLTTKKSY